MNQLKSTVICFHSVLLRLYPTNFRTEFEDEISDVFAQMVKEADTYSSLLNLCWRELRDWPTNVLTEYWLWWQESITLYLNRQRHIHQSRPGILPLEKIGGLPQWVGVLLARNPIVCRVFDLLFASFWLLVLSPFSLTILILIRLDSAGPVIYCHRRVGIDGQSFIMYKFRSMPVESERTRQTVTRVGKILRKYYLDELPQLFNILKGEMSVIGSRPDILG